MDEMSAQCSKQLMELKKTVKGHTFQYKWELIDDLVYYGCLQESILAYNRKWTYASNKMTAEDDMQIHVCVFDNTINGYLKYFILTCVSSNKM